MLTLQNFTKLCARNMLRWLSRISGHVEAVQPENKPPAGAIVVCVDLCQHNYKISIAAQQKNGLHLNHSTILQSCIRWQCPQFGNEVLWRCPCTRSCKKLWERSPHSTQTECIVATWPSRARKQESGTKLVCDCNQEKISLCEWNLYWLSPNKTLNYFIFVPLYW